MLSRAGKLQPFSFNVARVNQLLRHSDEGVRKRAKALFAEVASDRQKIISSYHDAASRRGDVARGKEVFRRVCSGCHRIGDMGSEVGPDLVNLGGRLTKGNLLTQILDPNASIAAGYEEYLIETVDRPHHHRHSGGRQRHLSDAAAQGRTPGYGAAQQHCPDAHEHCFSDARRTRA